MKVIIEESKMSKLSDHIEEGLRHIGKAMQCVDEWMEESGMGHRGGYGNRYDGDVYGNRYGMGERVIRHSGRMNYRDHEDWEDDEMGERYDEMGERRRRNRRTGRYM